MRDILFLHGFFRIDPEASPLLQAIRAHLPTTTIHAPAYHPNGEVKHTRIGETLQVCHEIISRSSSKQMDVIGVSFGGLLAAIFAEAYPELVRKLLLFAPAIDNFDRNYAGKPKESWIMPQVFVDELCTYPARPAITRPTTLVHGSLDNDDGGCAFWRIERWAREQSFEKIHLLDGVDHELEPWLSQQRCDAAPLGEGASASQVVTLGELLRAS
jgi:pimeloyl-ACP methyl ester carboxylesterase